MEKTKKNNKGFSLVELIVVVLIMAIIAVALAPQVMKWVEQSRQSADVQTKDSIVSGLALASADKAVYGSVIKVTVKSTGITWNTCTVPSGSTLTPDQLKAKINAIYDLTNVKCKSTATTITVEMNATGKVTGSITGLTDDVAAENP